VAFNQNCDRCASMVRRKPLLYPKQHTLRNFPLGPRAQFGLAFAFACSEANRRRLGAAVRILAFAAVKLRGFRAVCRRLLPRRELDSGRPYQRSRQTGSRVQSPFIQESCIALPTDTRCNQTPTRLMNTAPIIRPCGVNRNSCWRGGQSLFIGYWFRKR
jgi:hypothetical protein